MGTRSEHATAADADAGAGAAADAATGSARLGRTPAPRQRPAAEGVAVALLVTVAYLLIRPGFTYAAGAFTDDGVYIALGRALASGAGYRSIFLAHAPVHVKYPPGLPLVFALFWRLTGSLTGVIALASASNALLAGAAAALIWYYGRTALDLPVVPLAACALAPFFMEPVLQYNRIALSEPWLLAAWALALVLALRLRDPARSPAAAVLPLALVLGVAAIFRTHGLALVLAGAIAVALTRPRRAVAWFTAVALTPELVWLGARAYLIGHGPVSHSPGQLTYLSWALHTPLGLGVFLSAPAVNLRVYTGVLEHFVTPVHALTVLGLLLFPTLALLGTPRAWRDPFLPLGVPAFLALALVWPFPQDRLILPAVPFIGLLAAVPLAVLWRRGALSRVALATTLAVFLGLGAVQQVRLRYAGGLFGVGVVSAGFSGPDGPLLRNSLFIDSVAGWLRRHTPPDAVAMVDQPAGVYLYSGRRATNAAPPQPLFATTIWSPRGHYLAGRVLADSVTVLLDSGRSPYLRVDLNYLLERCPTLFKRVPGPRVPGVPAPRPLPTYLIGPQRACLRELLSERRAGH